MPMKITTEAKVLRRRAPARNGVRGGSAVVEQALRSIGDGDELMILTDGSTSMIDFVRLLLDVVGPSDVSIATWTMGIYDLEQCEAFVADRRIRNMRMVVDPSIFGRRPELSARLVRGFGVDAFRAANIHAKFCTLRNGRFDIAVRSSMNLNPNRRIEAADVSACREVAAFYAGFVERVFSAVAAGNQTQSESVFDRLFASDEAEAAPAMAAPRMRSLRSAIMRFAV